MTQRSQKTDYKPGYYGKKRLSAAAWVDANIEKWDLAPANKQQEKEKISFPYSICFSRQIGVGTLEIADLLSEIIKYRVIDRDILTYITKDSRLIQKILNCHEAQYPGQMNASFSAFTQKNPLITSDYAIQLVKTVIALAHMEPTIFVGRGTHLILPGSSILSVRLVSSKAYRVDRLANILNIETSEAETKLDLIDIEQHEFFKTVYQNKEPTYDEFDMVINRDRINGRFAVAKIVACALEKKFGLTTA
ncbi:cytidylate kinase-like family protein [Desulfobacula sp.]|uniref:cytidylate kinase-like family protein n=1 Tax=Desulfobacula sp. TaxID=2593537 RepID=UPI0026242E6B|nr:cytidylate kinase-like family protein [Desulfobacula sp.]